MKVSVLINNFNYAPYLAECFESLQKQTVRPDEVIFYDDGSSDNSVEIASSYDFVSVISNPNHGQKPGFNQGNAIYQAFLKSTGDIICLMDSDDFFTPDKIELVKKSFEANPDAVLVQHASFEYAGTSILRVLNNAGKHVVSTDLYYKKNWTAYFNSTSTMSYSRAYLEKVLPIKNDGNWRVWPDVRLSRIAPFYGKVISLSKPLTYYRRHDKNDSSQMNEDFVKSITNQTDHHEYLNATLLAMGKKPIAYQKSWMYFSYKLKTKLPVWLTKAIQNTKKALQKKR